MFTRSPKVLLRAYYQRKIKRIFPRLSMEDLAKPAVVFAPHQDDETLGCGGTLIKKHAAGADVALVFMTDGSQSHAHLTTRDHLVSLRKKEAIAAGSTLGVAGENILFLDFEDSQLDRCTEDALPLVMDILDEHKPEEVFIPYRKDVLPDHIATNQIVRSALKKHKNPVRVYEYPVWFWYHWPWVSLFQRVPRQTKAVIKNTFQTIVGKRISSDFNQLVRIDDLLEEKRKALSCYESQMTRFNANPQWAILSDISNGEFLSCFFQDTEIFHTYQTSVPN